VRPTADRVREALFAMLGDVSGAHVLDLFCGTGALGIEALSRGAAEATFVDLDPDLARTNVEELGLAERVRVIGSDALEFCATDPGRYDLVLCDPPYRLAAALGPELDRALPARLAAGARVIVESSPGAPLGLSLPMLRERRYGASLIRIHAEPGGERP
jgi:16S rRNA (guanine966-N2)-methyltransferase